MVLLYRVMLVDHSLNLFILRMVTFNDINATLPGPLPHTPPLFHQLKVLTIYYIFKLQVGKFVYESINDIGPSHSIITTEYLKSMIIIQDMLIMVIFSLILLGLIDLV